MKAIHLVTILTAAVAAPSAAQTLGTPGTEILFLVKSCSLAGHDTGTDCFENLADLVQAIWGTVDPPSNGIDPDSAHPLIVDVGPGTFEGSIACQGRGWVTFRGAGRDVSRIVAPYPTAAAVVAADCERLGFQDLDLEGPFWGALWFGGGSSSWTDVDLLGGVSGWQDGECENAPTDPPLGTHVFWNSRIEGRLSGVIAECGASKFFGSQIVARPVDASLTAVGVDAGYRAELHLFASDVRISLEDIGFTIPPAVYGARVGGAFFHDPGYGELHMQGGSVRVDTSSKTGVDAVALAAHRGGIGDAKLRAIETAFTLAPGAGGSPIRVIGDGTIESAFLWPPGSDVPIAGLVSKTGMDLYVETDCGVTGDCSGAGDPPLQPHLMVYRSSCASKWFDSVTGECKP